ncbi:hypothetical protein K1719_040369 [Acacia pycnantha]|nr:hypothetical protein K1719_040369 [Acacia pycnantha]
MASSSSSSLPLKDRAAIVTGASRGISRAITIPLHSLGARVVINYASSSNQADSLASELNNASNSSNHRATVVQADIYMESELQHGHGIRAHIALGGLSVSYVSM